MDILEIPDPVGIRNLAVVVQLVGGCLAVRVDVIQAIVRAALGYTNYFDGGDDNLLTDRDNVSFNVSYSF